MINDLATWQEPILYFFTIEINTALRDVKYWNHVLLLIDMKILFSKNLLSNSSPIIKALKFH